MLDLIKRPEMKEMVRKMIKTEMVKPYQKAAETEEERLGVSRASDYKLSARR